MPKTTQQSYSCMARSADGEPKPVEIISCDNSSALVKRQGGGRKRAIWLPKNMLYAPDARLMESLRRAYDAGDRATLDSGWREAQPWQGM